MMPLVDINVKDYRVSMTLILVPVDFEAGS